MDHWADPSSAPVRPLAAAKEQGEQAYRMSVHRCSVPRSQHPMPPSLPGQRNTLQVPGPFELGQRKGSVDRALVLATTMDRILGGRCPADLGMLAVVLQ